jgi:hypothetical protein
VRSPTEKVWMEMFAVRNDSDPGQTAMIVPARCIYSTDVQVACQLGAAASTLLSGRFA